MIQRDGFELMLSVAAAPEHVTPHGPHTVWDVDIRIADVAAEESALRATGVPLARGPETAFYSMREIEVLDPDGHRICFGQDVS